MTIKPNIDNLLRLNLRHVIAESDSDSKSILFFLKSTFYFHLGLKITLAIATTKA